VSKRRSVYKIRPDGKTVRRNQGPPPDQQWSWWTIEMMRSPAYRALSKSADRVIARIRIEFADHGGQDNGKLPVTYGDFRAYGIHSNAIAPAIREAAALGWIRITEFGVPSNAEFRKPTKFALTHMPVDAAAATDDWKRINSLQEAKTIAAAARKEPARYTRFPKKPKTGSRYGKRISQDTESVSLSIFRGGGRGKGDGQSSLSAAELLRVIGLDTSKLSATEIAEGAELARRVTQCDRVSGAGKRRPKAMADWRAFVKRVETMSGDRVPGKTGKGGTG
jgi:hypothetical protein